MKRAGGRKGGLCVGGGAGPSRVHVMRAIVEDVVRMIGARVGGSAGDRVAEGHVGRVEKQLEGGSLEGRVGSMMFARSHLRLERAEMSVLEVNGWAVSS